MLLFIIIIVVVVVAVVIMVVLSGNSIKQNKVCVPTAIYEYVVSVCLHMFVRECVLMWDVGGCECVLSG